MKKFATLAVALVATTALTGSVYALDQKNTADKTAMQDFNKLSKDGYKAMMEVRDARLAIFNAQPDKAKTDIENAQKALAKAKTDNTSFVKAEDALKPPANAKQANANTNNNTANNTNTNTNANATANKTPVTWLPINGALGIDEDFTASPAKAAGVAKANTQLKNGQHKEAMETLRLSDINMSFVMQVAPLDKTVQGVDQAAQLIGNGKYYEANQALKTVEDGIRYDVVDVSAVPKSASAQTSATTSGTAAQPAQPAQATPPATDKK